jgi:aspartyl-tRNA(Asn)/glutamyl-tRNA(Gln) amidotransferase subunit A
MGVSLCTASNLQDVQAAWNPFSAILPVDAIPCEPMGPLAGVATSVKDILDVAGVPTRWGSATLADAADAEADCEAVARLRRAGAQIVAKTTTSEFAHSPLGHAPATGLTLNPWNPKVTCGGSSGGAAVAVTTGATPLALATDAGCSTRLPAALAGVFGLKATTGRIPHEKMPEGFASLVHLGLIAKSLDLIATALGVTAGAYPDDPQSLGQPAFNAPALTTPDPVSGALAGKRIALWRFVGNAHVDDDVARQIEEAIAAMTRLGAKVDCLDYPLGNPTACWLVIQQVSAAARAAGIAPERQALLSATFRETARAGAQIDARTLNSALSARTATFRTVQKVFAAGYDFILTPCAAAAAVSADHPLDAPPRTVGTATGSLRETWLPYLPVFNLSGHPALALPSGLDRNGVPMGMQLVAPWWCETALLQAGTAWAQACPPPVLAFLV